MYVSALFRFFLLHEEMQALGLQWRLWQARVSSFACKNGFLGQVGSHCTCL